MKIKEVENNLKEVLKHWGFGEICASIYAVLALSDKPLTANEISRHIGYAYTTTINALNNSIGLGHVRKTRIDGKNVYFIDADISDIIKERLEKFLKILEKTKESIENLDSLHKKKLKNTLEMVEKAIHFLQTIEGKK